MLLYKERQLRHYLHAMNIFKLNLESWIYEKNLEGVVVFLNKFSQVKMSNYVLLQLVKVLKIVFIQKKKLFQK